MSGQVPCRVVEDLGEEVEFAEDLLDIMPAAMALCCDEAKMVQNVLIWTAAASRHEIADLSHQAWSVVAQRIDSELGRGL